MNVVKQLHSVLNHMVESEIKQKRTKGFQYIDSRNVICGSEHAFRLPIGKCAGDIERYSDAISASVGAPIEVIDRGGVVVLRIVEKDFPKELKFNHTHIRQDTLMMGYNRLMQPIYLPFKTFLLAGGAPSSGKTDWLRWVVYQLCLQGYLVFIVDLKGVSFFPFEMVPNVVVYDNLKDAKGCLKMLTVELERRKTLIKETRDRDLTEKMQKVAFIGDEAAVFSPNQHNGANKQLAMDCEQMIAYLSQQGREFKMFGIMAYQRPDDKTVNKQFKANVEASICFRTKDMANSRIILDKEGAEKISPTTPGRCIFQYDREYVLQVPFIGKDDAWEKFLQPLKTEVIKHGHSKRTETPRKHLDGTFTRSDSDNAATCDSKQQPRPKKKSVYGTTGLAGGWAGSRGIFGEMGKNMEINSKREEVNGDISDEVL